MGRMEIKFYKIACMEYQFHCVGDAPVRQSRSREIRWRRTRFGTQNFSDGQLLSPAGPSVAERPGQARRHAGKRVVLRYRPGPERRSHARSARHAAREGAEPDVGDLHRVAPTSPDGINLQGTFVLPVGKHARRILPQCH
jgi:hypothetical protein